MRKREKERNIEKGDKRERQRERQREMKGGRDRHRGPYITDEGRWQETFRNAENQKTLIIPSIPIEILLYPTTSFGVQQ